LLSVQAPDRKALRQSLHHALHRIRHRDRNLRDPFLSLRACEKFRGFGKWNEINGYSGRSRARREERRQKKKGVCCFADAFDTLNSVTY
jgi:hypothetical protein